MLNEFLCKKLSERRYEFFEPKATDRAFQSFLKNRTFFTSFLNIFFLCELFLDRPGQIPIPDPEAQLSLNSEKTFLSKKGYPDLMM